MYQGVSNAFLACPVESDSEAHKVKSVGIQSGEESVSSFLEFIKYSIFTESLIKIMATNNYGFCKCL